LLILYILIGFSSTAFPVFRSPDGSNADLINIYVNGIPLSGFDPDVTIYNVVLPYGSSGVTVTAAVYDLMASFVITGPPSLPGSATVKVTAEDGLTTKTYTINFTIADAPAAIYTVTFYSDGSVYASASVKEGESIGNSAWPADPVKNGYTFEGWFTEENGRGTQFTPETPVNALMSVYSKWTYISGGSGGGNFSPDVKLTRGEFIVLLMRAYGIAPDENPSDNFEDAGNTYYTGYLASAKRLGISKGTGNNMYAPEKEITRQEMFTLLCNTLKTTGGLPEGFCGKTLSDFTDAGRIDSWTRDAMELFIGTGIVSGRNGALSPHGTATRAEIAQVLYNLLCIIC